jgi:hypothetical protein
MTVVPKKSIFEKMGLIDPINKDSENTDEVMSEEIYEEVPELDFVPDLTKLESNEPQSDDAALTAAKDIPKDIGDKLDLIIGAYEKNKLLTIEEIYRNAHLENEVKKTIFMADVYQKAIPENLPLDIKRETVLNIMNVSSISLEELLNDAYKRIDALNTVLEETEINKNRKKFQEDQNTMIEYEIQKIINLVEFVKPKK